VQQLLYSGGESFIEIKTIERQLIKELKRNGLWNYGKEAITHTLHDIERFKKFITLIQDNAISSEEKYSAALYVKTFNNSLKLLSNMIDERDFSIFYNYYIPLFVLQFLIPHILLHHCLKERIIVHPVP
jgi:hypothetical protein